MRKLVAILLCACMVMSACLGGTAEDAIPVDAADETTGGATGNGAETLVVEPIVESGDSGAGELSSEAVYEAGDGNANPNGKGASETGSGSTTDNGANDGANDNSVNGANSVAGGNASQGAGEGGETSGDTNGDGSGNADSGNNTGGATGDDVTSGDASGNADSGNNTSSATGDDVTSDVTSDDANGNASGNADSGNNTSSATGDDVTSGDASGYANGDADSGNNSDDTTGDGNTDLGGDNNLLIEVVADGEALAGDEAAPETPAEAPTDYGSGPAFIWEGDIRHYGALDELLPIAGGAVIFIRSSELIELHGYSVDSLRGCALSPDYGVFSDDMLVIVSALSPSGNTKADVTFVWVGRQEDVPQPAKLLEDIIVASDEDILEREIQVTTSGFSSSEPCRPSFTLCAIPDMESGMSYAVIKDGGQPAPIGGNVYTPAESGGYRFALLDESGAVLARSAAFTVEYAEDGDEGEPNIEPNGGAADDNITGDDTTEEADTEPDGDTTDSSAANDDITSGGSAEGADTEPDGDTTDSSAANDDITSGGSAEGANTEPDNDTPSNNTSSNAAFDDEETTIEYETNDGTADENGDSIDDNIIIRDDADGGSDLESSLISAALTSSDGTILTLADAAADPAAALEAATPSIPTLTVTPDAAFVDSAWAAAPVAFALASLPDIADASLVPLGYAYAVSVDDGYPVKLTAASFAADSNGAHTLKFHILDANNVSIAESILYTVKLDMTLPLIMASSPESLTLDITAGDLVSAITGVSVDGGQSWLTPNDVGEGVYTLRLRAASAVTFAPGSIVAMDEAGNQASNANPVSLTASAPTTEGMDGGAQNGADNASGGASFGGSGGGGGGGGTSSRSVSHASASATGVTAYNGVELVVADGLMNRLMIGDEPLELDLLPDKNGAIEDSDDHVAGFIAEFISLDGGDDVNTLALSCADELDAEGGYSYTWEFTGAVYKKLAASGVDYMLLRVGERVAVLSTAGFSAGVRYSMYRAEGHASKDFRYAVTIGAPDPTIRMSVTVDGETYDMTDDSNTEFYYYDVQVGSADEFLVTDEA